MCKPIEYRLAHFFRPWKSSRHISPNREEFSRKSHGTVPQVGGENLLTIRSPRFCSVSREVLHVLESQYGKKGAAAFVVFGRGEADLDAYAKRFDRYYKSGRIGLSFDQIPTNLISESPHLAKVAFDAGVRHAKETTGDSFTDVGQTGYTGQVENPMSPSYGARGAKEPTPDSLHALSSQATPHDAEKVNVSLDAMVEAEVTGVSKVRFFYKNNPMENPKAAKDIIENPDAVYGYSPKLGSSLEEFYNKIDWTNQGQVSDAKLQRIKYHEGLEIQKDNLDQVVNQLFQKGYSMEDIARMKVNERNSHRIEMYIKRGNYQGLEAMKARNMKQHQNPNGPTPDQLFEKYGSWEEVIYASVRSNPGMDACTGLYDIYGGD